MCAERVDLRGNLCRCDKLCEDVMGTSDDAHRHVELFRGYVGCV